MLIEMLEMSGAPSLTNHTDFRQHKDVCQTNSDKRGDTIQDPVNDELVCLGICNSAEQDSNVSCKKKLQFDSIDTNATVEETEVEFTGQVEMNCKESSVHVKDEEKAHSSKTTNQPSVNLGDLQEISSSLVEYKADRQTCDEYLAQAISNTDVPFRVTRAHGSGSIYRTKTGKWRADINHRKSKVYVGIYKTYEEAEEAIHRKRQDIGSVTFDEVVVKDLSLKEHELDPVFGSTTPSKQDLPKSESTNGELTCMRPRGVYQRKSGRWYAEIRNPMTNSRGSVGTYETAEEALEVLNKKRREYALIENAEKKLKKPNVDLIESNGDEAGLASKSWDIVVVKDECIEFDTSLSFVRNEEFDTGVIDAYGQLVGEFSRLDDELWLSESLE